jgi:hypothetical protein
MKHLERIKKMVTWAYTNEWIDKDPFIAYKLRFKRHEMEFLDKDELARIEGREPGNPMLRRVRDLFIFSCYTGLAYIDLVFAETEQHSDQHRWHAMDQDLPQEN